MRTKTHGLKMQAKNDCGQFSVKYESVDLSLLWSTRWFLLKEGFLDFVSQLKGFHGTLPLSTAM